ncbi:MAG TPA: hypothetical protein VNO50_18055 [Pyrinomonadaceae bacterium]|nr:hypothetical protein [Pyrinomonadaceae bacterium]
MNRLLALIICAATLVGFSWIEARACTCALPLPNLTLKQQVKKAQKQSRAVFVGKVMQVVQNPDASGVSVKFLVEKSWKGRLTREVTISTGLGGGDCGYRFEVGESYLVYASGANKLLSTSICQRTAPRSENGDMKHLGKGRRPL